MMNQQPHQEEDSSLINTRLIMASSSATDSTNSHNDQPVLASGSMPNDSLTQSTKTQRFNAPNPSLDIEPVADQTEQIEHSTSIGNQGESNETENESDEDNEEDDEENQQPQTPFTLFSNIVRSYMNATNRAATRGQQPSQNPPSNASASPCPSASAQVSANNLNDDFLQSSENGQQKDDIINTAVGNDENVNKFEPKSELFQSLLNQYNESIGNNPKEKKLFDSLTKPLKNWNENSERMLNLFFYYENYHCAMLQPVDEVFKVQEIKSSDSKCNYVSSKMLDDELEQIDSIDQDTKSFQSCVANNKSSDYSAIESFETEKEYKNNTSDGSNDSKSISNSQSLILSQTDGADTNIDLTSNMNKEFYFKCELCYHYLHEPITLVCGCTFCSNCINEYNSMQNDESREKGNFMSDSEETDSSNEESSENEITPSSNGKMNRKKNNSTRTIKCFNCSRSHNHNSKKHLKQNVFIGKLVDKLWLTNTTVRRLRTDIRNYICYDLKTKNNFDLSLYESLLLKAYDMDKTNHMILADLFLVNYFSGQYDKCLNYSNLAVALNPIWPFSYYMRSLVFQKLGDEDQLKINLLRCLQLNPSNEQIRLRLCQLLHFNTKQPTTDNSCGLSNPNISTVYRSKSKKNHCISQAASNDHETNDENCQHSKNNSQAIKRSLSASNKDANLNESISLKKHRYNSINQSNEEMSTSSTDLETIPLSKDSDTQSSNTPEASKPLLNGDSNAGAPSMKNELISGSSLRSAQKNNSTEKLLKLLNETSVPCQQHSLSINTQLIKTTDLECSLCYRMLYNPVTTPCGHMFCCGCLDRVLDHNAQCPLCKHPLDQYLAERRQFRTIFVEKLIQNYFRHDYEERARQNAEEMQELIGSNEVPIFVCTLALPCTPYPLHVFEPRYKLMLRRALEYGGKQFGMCMYSEKTPYRFSEYGCMVEIKSHQFTRDGRAIVATLGNRRFKVVKVVTKDGYNVAQVEWIKDTKVTVSKDLIELKALHDEVYRMACDWFDCIPEHKKIRLFDYYGTYEVPSPEADIQANDNGPTWHWFFINIFPIPNDLQYRFLPKTNLKDRLLQMKRLLICFMRPVEIRRINSSNNSHQISSSSNDISHSNANSSTINSGRSSSQTPNDSNATYGRSLQNVMITDTVHHRSSSAVGQFNTNTSVLSSDQAPGSRDRLNSDS